ncbi:hypothetical protein Dsin_024927 [Dipteronia sinensis]|uniref:RNase H type-1 domain-containing protein n=1 Tax=Dipteronia sinensis TaxID=43782 RepID=A0AAD9ZVC3_9ROSI|nr:hypothetical protein Dsin_024927 [Dipteronia sinensis]
MERFWILKIGSGRGGIGIYALGNLALIRKKTNEDVFYLSGIAFQFEDTLGTLSHGPSRLMERAWCSMFFTVVWTIWECRNQLIFEGKEPEVSQAADLVKFRIVWWFKHLRSGSKETVNSLLLNLKDLCVDHTKVKRTNIEDWISPSADILKFNVDGSVIGKPGPSGIGGVLRDLNGKVLCLFSYYMEIMDSNTTELWAITKAVELILSNPNLRGCDIWVVSDSKVAVLWVNNGEFGSIAQV